jgi:hypothetical protein
MGIFDLFWKDKVVGAKVLVCALDTRFEDLLKEDSEVYRRYYPATTTEMLPTIQALLGRLEQWYDIVHVLCDVTEQGTITDANGNEITGTQLIQNCCDQNVKLLWAASDNSPDFYIKGFGARLRKRLNLVVTIHRKGVNFPASLQKLLSRMSHGDTMPVAWNDLWPQVPGSHHPDAPESILFAGRGGVRLLE